MISKRELLDEVVDTIQTWFARLSGLRPVEDREDFWMGGHYCACARLYGVTVTRLP